jgi:hypothetical protein
MKLTEVYEQAENHEKLAELYGVLIELEPKREAHYLMHSRSLTKIRNFILALNVLDRGLAL